MKNETTWILEDLLEMANNDKLDFEFDLKDKELGHLKNLKQDCLRIIEEKITELENCINWIKNIKHES